MTEFTETASFLGYALVGFVIILYLPHIIFKFLAEQHVDLGGRRDSTRLEEFIGAAFPSVLLNFFAFLTYEFVCLVTPRLESYDVDWAVIASIFAVDKGALADFIYAGDLWRSVGLYLVILYVIAIINGWVYGIMIHTWLQRNEEPPGLKKILNAPLSWRIVPETVAWLWHVFYNETMVPFAGWTMRETWVMVRTVDNRIYHGRFARYEKSLAGEFEMIRLEEVRRYCFNEIEQRYARGQIAVSTFHGILHIKWSQIADINIVDPNKIFEIMTLQYEELKERHAAKGLPPPPVPPGLDLPPEDDTAPPPDATSS